MKKLIIIAILLVTAVTGSAQVLDNFIVGPYEVDYYGEGDIRPRIRKGIDLYEYFGLKRDTIIQNIVTKESKPVKHGVQVDVFMSMPAFGITGKSNTLGLSGTWKQQIGKKTYLNAGLSMGFLGILSNDTYPIDGNLFELGIPLSVEFTKLDYKQPSVYLGVGLIPTIYSTTKENEILKDGKKIAAQKYSGFLVSPRLDFGGYIPLNNQLLRIGVYTEYKLNCSGDINIYHLRIGRAFVGANIGLVF